MQGAVRGSEIIFEPICRSFVLPEVTLCLSYPADRAAPYCRCAKMLIRLEGAHAFCVSIFGGVEHFVLRSVGSGH